jgi:hypothetical protein
MRNGADPRNGYGDKIRPFNDATGISIKVVTGIIVKCNMGAKMIIGIIIVLNKFSISVASWGCF